MLKKLLIVQLIFSVFAAAVVGLLVPQHLLVGLAGATAACALVTLALIATGSPLIQNSARPHTLLLGLEAVKWLLAVGLLAFGIVSLGPLAGLWFGGAFVLLYVLSYLGLMAFAAPGGGQ
ncbi:MAG: hypothetical protein ISN29_04160 [Gammaproteobacteria bacterium AqS3]|nr:hypothetical protein [Gammaproteobacteria bacterium AqS3]